MRTVRTFAVSPSLPESLKRLKDVVENLFFSWDHDPVALFLRLDRELWEECGHNPVKMLGRMSQEQLNAAAENDALLAHLDRVCRKVDSYVTGKQRGRAAYEAEGLGPIAYFSAEFGLHESVPIYSGGLGILAGDHLKSASDLGLPFVGIGLLYRQGYFQQYLNADGWQQESFPQNDIYNMPIGLMMREDGRPIRFHVGIGGNDVVAQIWRAKVGRVDLYLLDTNLRCNRIEDRQITSQLYGGDSEMRLRQEILLGIGGCICLRTLGIEPGVCHINEGHAAFSTLERIAYHVQEKQLTFAQAREATVCGSVFTTHTPVPAGHDVFAPVLMEKYFGEYYKRLGLGWEDFLALGRTNRRDNNEPFSMTALAMHLSSHRNGVSALHGSVSRQMSRKLWPQLPLDDIPITSVTNGIHVGSWISYDMAELFDRYLGPAWKDRTSDATNFDRIDHIPDEELWRTHERRRERLVAFARWRLRTQLRQRGASQAGAALADEVLDPEALTIGFARRFATYKRGALLFSDTSRFRRILANKDRPVQVIFAGKAHPRDTAGKELIRKIVHLCREDEVFRRRVVFLENYDINVARYLVQGVDVWLNTPRRPMEASGTSGMKVLANGGINLSILDGWWCEGYEPDTGWGIGQGESYDDDKYADEVESNALYDLLETEVIPKFYKIGRDRLPREWIKLMKSSMRKLTWRFSTSRMVAEYAERFYLPSARRSKDLTSDDMAKAKTLADWKESMRDRWGEVAVAKVDTAKSSELQVGSDLEVRSHVRLGSIEPGDVVVELYHGLTNAEGEIQKAETVAMEWQGKASEGVHIFAGNIHCRYSGLCGFAVRVIPSHPDLAQKFDTGLICWDESASPAIQAQSVASTVDEQVEET